MEVVGYVVIINYKYVATLVSDQRLFFIVLTVF